MRLAATVLAIAAAGVAAPALSQVPAGRELFLRADKGHCAACHQVGAGEATGARPDVGPALQGARMRELGKAALRAIVQDPTRANPDTLMPPFGRHRILDDREIDRVVDYLHALP